MRYFYSIGFSTKRSHYFIAQTAPYLAIRRPFNSVLCCFNKLPTFVSIFLLSDTKGFSKLTFPTPALKSGIAPRSPDSFYWRILETKIRKPGVLMTAQIIRRSRNWEPESIYTQPHPLLSLSLCMCIITSCAHTNTTDSNSTSQGSYEP